MAKPLRAVEPGETARKPPQGVAEAAESSERDLLVALRTHLATEMDAGKVPAHALASVSAKLREYDRDVRLIDARTEQEASQREQSADEAWSAV